MTGSRFPGGEPCGSLDPGVRPHTGESIKLLIWDLHETFWSDALEESGIRLIRQNLPIVRSLTERGMVNSIATKNPFARAPQALDWAGIWDQFVVPQIAVLPKGELVRAVIGTCPLRAPSVLCIDENTINLKEVAHYIQGIHAAMSDLLRSLRDDPRCRGSDDRQLSRLRNYKIVEQRKANCAEHANNNTEFLCQNGIRISFHHDTIGPSDRVHQLMNRTNQVNFTKRRIAGDIDTASNGSPAHSGAHGVICMRGACELSQTAHYLRERHVTDEEFPFPVYPWEIARPLTDYFTLQVAYRDPETAPLFDRPWFDPAVMQGRLFDRSADIYVLSFGQEPNIFRYRHKASGLVFPINLTSFNTRDLTRLSYADATAKFNVRMTEDEWMTMQAEFECLWRFDADVFERNLRALLAWIADKCVIIVLANTRYGNFEVQKERHEQVNDIIRHVAHGKPIKLIAMDDVIHGDDEMLEMNHFKREVYMRLAGAIEAELASPTPAIDLQPYQPPARKRRNLLPASDTFSAKPWVSLNDAEVEHWPARALFPGTAILLHRRTTDANRRTIAVFGCRMINRLIPGDYYTASAWVWIPNEYRGKEVGLFCAGRSSHTIRRASFYPREVWQLVWVTVQVPLDQMSLLPALGVLGDAGSEVHSTGWQLVSGLVHSNVLPELAPTGPQPNATAARIRH